MRKANSLISIDRNGEFIYHGLNSHMSKKYKADTPLDKSFVPYLIMVLCGTIDAACFINLFKIISYDSPFLLAIQVAGFLFAFDVVPSISASSSGASSRGSARTSSSCGWPLLSAPWPVC